MAAEPIGAIRALLSASAAVFENDMKRARTAVKSSTTDMRTAFERVEDVANKTVKGIFTMRTALGLLAGATGLYYATRAAINFADNIDEVATAAGQTAEEFQSYAYAASLAGIAQEDYTTAVSKFAIVVGDAKRNSKGAQAQLFNSLGIDQEMLKTKSQTELLQVLAERFSKVTDPARLAAIAVDVFGKSGIKMGQFLAQGNTQIDALREKAQALGIVLSNETVKAAAKAADELDTMDQVIKVGLTATMLEFVPVVQEFAKTVQNPAVVGGIQSIAGGIRTLLEVINGGLAIRGGFVQNIQDIGTFGAMAGKNIAKVLAQDFSNMMNGDLSNQSKSPLMDGLKNTRAEYQANAQAAAQYNEAMSTGILAQEEFNTALTGDPEGGGSGGTIGGLGNVTDNLGKNTKALMFKNEGLLQLIARYRDFHNTVEELQDDIEIENMALSQNIAINSKAGQQWVAAERQNRALQRAYADQRKVLDEIRTPTEAYADEVQRLDELLAMGALNQDQFNLALGKAKDRYAQAQGAVKGLAGAGKEMGDAMADSLGKMLDGTESAIDGLKGLAKALIDIALRKAVLEPAGAALGNVFGNILGSLGNGLSGAKANGGSVFAGRSYLVGEKGPEIFTPPGTGNIIPNHEMGGSGGNVYQIDARGVDASALTRMEAMLMRLAGPGVIEKRVIDASARGKL